MDFFELLAKEIGTPILCFDGAVGMLTRYPLGESPINLAGVEVPGEPDIRWIPRQDLKRAGEALRQNGSPPFPLASWPENTSEQTALSRRLLGELWNALQPEELRELGSRVLRPDPKGR